MKYYRNILETVGNTPLVKINALVGDCKGTVLAKVESFNPGGSVKDRIAIKMIEVAERDGLLKRGGTIIEPTSGNTGSGLALIACIKGYSAIFTMPDKMSMEKELILRAHGAEVIRTPTAVEPEDPRSYYKVAERLVAETDNAFSPSQYFNQNNPLAHYETTAPEIWRDTDGKITHFVAGIGTGGTITGTARFLKEHNSDIQIIGADPEGSLYYHRFYGTEGEIHVYKTEGIGEDFMPTTVDMSVIDAIELVTDKQAFAMARQLIHQEGILVGSSSGSAMVAAQRVASTLKEDDVLVVLFPDTGKNYLSTVFNDQWMKDNELL